MEPQEEHNEAEKGKRNMEKLFDLQVFAQENTQTTGGLSAEMKTYYGMELLDNAKPQLVHNQFAATKPLPTGGGKTLDSAVTAADNAVIYPGEGGAEGCAVYGCLFVGKGAYGVVDLNDGTEVIVKPRGSSGTADPLDQRSSVGWKGVHAAAILYDEYIVRVECGSSYSGQDKAN